MILNFFLQNINTITNGKKIGFIRTDKVKNNIPELSLFFSNSFTAKNKKPIDHKSICACKPVKIIKKGLKNIKRNKLFLFSKKLINEIKRKISDAKEINLSDKK